MVSVDFHSHTLFSACGLHSILEMLTEAKRRGLAGLAITDHGPAMKGRVNTTFFERLINPLDGIRLLKGMECNLVDDQGAVDFPMGSLKWADVLLLGIHPNTPQGLGAHANTAMLCNAIRKNPFLDIISHANEPQFPVDYNVVAAAAAFAGLAIEINNSKVLHKRCTPADTAALLDACKKSRCRVIVSSDAHALNEIGGDESVRPIIDSVRFPEELIVNATAERAFTFVEERRKFKT
ncbi:MAG: PHP domain-containing protein [Chitinivibrionales bacterium]|nr:PHP domain-containing protein [Chitinivibrionales bacterium]